MGSQSDWEVMKEAKDQLDEFSILNEQLIISAHRTPNRILDYAKKSLKNGVKVIGIMPGNTPLATICDFPLTIDVGINNRISKPVTSRIAYTAVIDVLTMGVAQLKPEAQEHLYNIADSQRSLKIDN